MKLPNQKYIIIALVVILVFFIVFKLNTGGLHTELFQEGALSDWVTGSWANSCKYTKYSDRSYLNARCKKDDGTNRETTIKYSYCKNKNGKIDVRNENGFLKC
jgi:hypothetical protein